MSVKYFDWQNEKNRFHVLILMQENEVVE